MTTQHSNTGTPQTPEIRSATLTLCGEALQLRTDQPPEVVQRLAGYINDKVKVLGGGTGLAPENFRLLALATLGITGELFETQARLKDTEEAGERMLARARTLNEALDRALAP